MAEFRNWIEQALAEIDDLRAAVEFDEEYMGDAGTLVEPLERSLKTLAQAAQSDSYMFGGAELPFMPRVKAYDESVLPLRPLLIRLNETHVHGRDDSR